MIIKESAYLVYLCGKSVFHSVSNQFLIRNLSELDWVRHLLKTNEGLEFSDKSCVSGFMQFPLINDEKERDAFLVVELIPYAIGIID